MTTNILLPIVLKQLGTTVTKHAIEKLVGDRKKKAIEILIAKIRAGNQGKTIFDAAEVEALVPIVHRFIRAAEEGTARRNLNILARVVAGQISSKALYPDKFLSWCDTIASLSYEELIFLGELYQNDLALRSGPRLDEPTISNQALGNTRKKLAEIYKINFDTADALASACQRTGFVVHLPIMTDRPAFKVTPKMHELMQLIGTEGQSLIDQDFE
jgi:hypothetical protein